MSGDDKKKSKGKDICAILLEKVTKSDIEKAYREFNVHRERVQLYKHFILTLSKYIHTTYLGIDCIKTPVDIKGHFNWCFTKTIGQFDSIGFKFYNTEEIHDYFLEYYGESIYTGDEKCFNYELDKKYIENIFDYDNTNKNRLKLLSLIEFYTVFEKAFNKTVIEKITTKKRILITK